MEPSSVATAPQMADIKDETPVIKTVKVGESADNLIDDYSVWLNHNREKMPACANLSFSSHQGKN